MSNRRKPSNEPNDAPWHTGSVESAALLADYIARTTHCPDCNSAATVERDDPLVHVLFTHDDGCPWLSGVTGR